MKFRYIPAAFCALAMLILASPSQAQVLHGTFQGNITKITSDAPLPGVALGDPFIFDVVYDLSPTSMAINGNPPTLGAYWWFGENYSMSASFGAYNIFTVDNNQLEVRANPAIPQYGFVFSNAFLFSSGGYSAPGGSFFGLILISTQGDPVFTDVQIQNIENHPIADFETNTFRVYGNFGSVAAQVEGAVTSYTVVPESASLTLLLAGAAALGFPRRLRSRQ